MMPNVGKELVPALQKALADYIHFSETSAPTDVKEFNAFHNACKAALLHIALLVKLTQKETNQIPDEPNLFSLLNQAKKDLQNDDDISGICLDLG